MSAEPVVINLDVPRNTEWGLPGQMLLLRCPKCNRKIVVALGLFGSPHHFAVHATCSECLVIDAAFEKNEPEATKQLRTWQAAP